LQLTLRRLRPIWGVILLLGCLWPVLHWMALRSRDGSDEPWSLLALVTLAAIGVFRYRQATPEREIDWLLPGLALAAYALSFPFLTPLPRALLGLSSLALALSQCWYARKLHAGVLGLCWLTIPLMASLEFYASYPLRVLSAELAKELLGFGGLAVDRLGVNLVADGREVAVDPACSGLKMLWAGAYAISVLGCLLPISGVRAFLCVSAALGLLIAGNAWRTAALFYSESGMLTLPSGAHDAVGFVVFALVLGAIAALWSRIARSQVPVTDAPAAKRRHTRFFAAACVLALTATFVPAKSASQPSFAEFEGWPRVYEGRPLTEVPAPTSVAEFYRRFPGKVAHFRSGSTRYVFRFLTEPTRRLHPAQHCYRASGFDTDPESACLREDGQRYGCFTARRGADTVAVSERVYDGHGGTWTDVSAWYWAAMLGRSQGPWWVVTIAEPEPSPEQRLVTSQP
jgi:exosortase/archaeosortase family protein